MNFRVRQQLAEALGPVNRWFASQARGRHVENPEELITHFVSNGGPDIAAPMILRRVAKVVSVEPSTWGRNPFVDC